MKGKETSVWSLLSKTFTPSISLYRSEGVTIFLYFCVYVKVSVTDIQYNSSILKERIRDTKQLDTGGATEKLCIGIHLVQASVIWLRQ